MFNNIENDRIAQWFGLVVWRRPMYSLIKYYLLVATTKLVEYELHRPLGVRDIP